MSLLHRLIYVKHAFLLYVDDVLFLLQDVAPLIAAQVVLFSCSGCSPQLAQVGAWASHGSAGTSTLLYFKQHCRQEGTKFDNLLSHYYALNYVFKD